MSWGGHIETNGVHFKEDLDGLDMKQVGYAVPESLEQSALAKALACQLMQSGFLGDSSSEFHVSFSGHANEGHKPVAGWAGECITISVRNKK